jgi:hypothetical protein
MNIKIILLSIFFFAVFNAACQNVVNNDSTKFEYFKQKMYSIEMYDGATFTGTFVSESILQIVIATQSLGTITIDKSKIKSRMEILDTAYKNGEYWFENPNATRYVIGPSAFSLKKGEGYYQNLYLFGQSVNFGITDHFSIGAGTEIASIIFAQEAPKVFFLTPKVGFVISTNFKVGAGVLYVHVAEGGSSKSRTDLGVIYGLGTYGNFNNNITFGLGWGFHRFKTTDYLTQQTSIDKGIYPKPIITISGMTRVSKRVGLVSENWIFPISTYDNGSANSTGSKVQVAYSLGVRFMGERIAVDFGFANTNNSGITLGIPYIDFVLKFGGKSN